jgi:hypothetical protein
MFVRVISTEAGKQLANSWKAIFLETSAKEHKVLYTKSSVLRRHLVVHVIFLPDNLKAMPAEEAIPNRYCL